MKKTSSNPFMPFMGPGQDAFKLWISFFPVAPLFGVEWRFGDPMQGFAAFGQMPGMPGQESAGRRGAGPKPAQAKKAATPVRAVEPAPKSEPSPKPAPKAAEPAPRPVPETKPEQPAPAPKAEEPKPAPKAEPKPAPAAEPKPAPAEASADLSTGDGAKPKGLMSKAPATPDDLKLIKGIGPGLESKLNALGIYTFEQIAGFSEQNLVWVDENLTAFKGRCFRDDWVGQARGLID